MITNLFSNVALQSSLPYSDLMEAVLWFKGTQHVWRMQGQNLPPFSPLLHGSRYSRRHMTLLPEDLCFLVVVC